MAAPGRVSYSVSKAGVIMLTSVLARELASHNIRVNAIAPGWVKTELTKVQWGDPETYKQLTATIPMGHWAEISDIASVALFLASDASSYMTGHTIVVDGGVLAYPDAFAGSQVASALSRRRYKLYNGSRWFLYLLWHADILALGKL
ncbi:unnamed protein product [marine sediment metagenome]|uniref:Short-chain dehydrogenase/reductase SDR n=1 Tax=marine sediment metagenome TaxID=412755 RepID=X1KHV7_9ZZZZ